MATCGLSLGLALLSTCTSADFQYPGVFVAAWASLSQFMHNSILNTVQVIFLQYRLPGLIGFTERRCKYLWHHPSLLYVTCLQNQYHVNGSKFHYPQNEVLPHWTTAAVISVCLPGWACTNSPLGGPIRAICPGSCLRYSLFKGKIFKHVWIVRLELKGMARILS